jgi:hypothetical protein
MAEEVDRKHQDLLALEKSLRSDIDTRLVEGKRRLEADLSRAAGELAAAQREREAAETARQAAAAEAERKIAEYRSAFERMHAEEEAKLKAEKARIEAEAERIQGVHRFFALLAHQRGFKVKEIHTPQAQADTCRRVYSPGTYLGYLLDFLTVFFLVKFTKRPLRFLGILGSGVFALGFLITLYLIAERLLGGVLVAV